MKNQVEVTKPSALGDYCIVCGEWVPSYNTQTIVTDGDKTWTTCVGCGNKAVIIDVWKVGNDDIGWCWYDNYERARIGFMSSEEIDDEFEIVKERMPKTEYDNMPEFEGY